MSNSKKLLDYWVKEGLISDEQKNAIVEHTKLQTKENHHRSLAALAVFTIVVGILSIVAANWAIIPGTVKIFVHLLLNAGIGFLAYKFYQEKRQNYCEIATLGFFGLTLTLLALIGQVFQMNGALTNLLIMWIAASSPVILYFGYTKITGVPYIVAFIVVLVIAIWHFLIETHTLMAALSYEALIVLLPMAMVEFANVKRFAQWKPAYAGIMDGIGKHIPPLLTIGMCLLWFADREGMLNELSKKSLIQTEQIHLFLLTVFLFAGVFLWRFFDKIKNDSFDGDEINRFLHLCCGLFFMSLPIFFITKESALIGVTSIVSYLLYLCLTDKKNGHSAVTAVATLFTFAWYANRQSIMAEDIGTSGMNFSQTYFLILLSTSPVILWFLRQYYGSNSWKNNKTEKAKLLHCAVSSCVILLPFLIYSKSADVVAMITFVLYWLFSGWTAHMLGLPKAVSLAILLIAFRVFSIYLEAFGGLLSTGVALLSGGIVLLILIYTAQKLNKYLVTESRV
jgi:hypothetical protein